MAEIALSIQNLSKSFERRSGEPIVALDNVSLDVHRGEFVAIVGPSGCGKSTLFNIIGGLLEPTSGQVTQPMEGADSSRARIGMVFQQDSSFPWRTVLENVAFPLEMMGMAKAERLEKAAHFVHMVGLSDFRESFPHQLSGGMRQRICIARTLAYEPDILLLDEPFAALDEQTRMLLGDQLTQICADLKQTSLLITHNISEAVQLSDRVVMLSFRPGRIIDVIPVDLPRPRSSDVFGSDQFAKLVGTIWAKLKVEANKGLISNA
ncbi:MAG: ABC transporter ATP-binding protein [Gammaproteobacteria bacterium]|nr:ABC transporter ATP-binding protein [Gammaproteobacteria bacterium]